MSDNRKLCSAEQMMEILNRRASTFNVVTHGRILGPMTEEIVRQALDLVQERHPRLNSRIVGDDDNLRFETGAKKIPLRVVEQQHSEQWQEILTEELNTKIESYEVLLRAVLVKEQNENSASHLIITIHHAITDGLSSIQLYSEILTYCQKIAGGEPHSPAPSYEVLPPVDELFPPSKKGFRGIINSLLFLLKFKLKLLWYRPETLSFEKTVPIEERRCGIVCRQLDAEFTKQLINRYREEETTVQGALSAAMLFAAARKIRAGQKTRVNCYSSIDLRKRLKPLVSKDKLGVLVSTLGSFHTLGTNTSFWELARDVRQQLEVGLKGSDIFSQVLMMRETLA
ncbi:MAG: hypothetical protein EBE86_033395 [Hormoscilla sp. GUM202]|nr:hypothetical protein [Hormoscilla sp. GUM202]